jgi:hypothetical protein
MSIFLLHAVAPMQMRHAANTLKPDIIKPSANQESLDLSRMLQAPQPCSAVTLPL